MVAVAQLVESRIVIPVVVGSSPIGHPNKFNDLAQFIRLGFVVSGLRKISCNRCVTQFGEYSSPDSRMVSPSAQVEITDSCVTSDRWRGLHDSSLTSERSTTLRRKLGFHACQPTAQATKSPHLAGLS